ncbi:hypothetical protein AVEN_210725-1 [Araneus ventricosus]|uniref:Uncharacterized protein n=1 Tax=Araneus ventricosus TaxID=182803 RepID=A0A4Y2MKN3_ARAVE|nr:hypothetical protein AVEN_210725-1 [Araneus ventricosus]
MRNWGILSHSRRSDLFNCELFLQVISDHQLFSLECPKHVILGFFCLRNMLSNPFEGILRRKGNCPMWPCVIVHENRFIPYCCSVRDHNRSEDTHRGHNDLYIPDNVQVGVAIDRHTGPDHNSASANFK